MSASKRPSTSSLRRFISSRPYVTVAELRRRFALDDPDAMAHLARNGTAAWIGLPEREAARLQELWERDEIGLELSVEVRAPVVIGVYPMRIARYLVDGPHPGSAGGALNGAHPHPAEPAVTQGTSGMGVTNGRNGTGAVEAREARGPVRRPWPVPPAVGGGPGASSSSSFRDPGLSRPSAGPRRS